VNDLHQGSTLDLYLAVHQYSFMRFAEAFFMEQIMSSQSTTRFPVEAFPRGVGTSGSSEQPVVLLAFAKLIVIAGFLAIFTPAWMDLSRELAATSHTWDTLRVVALAGAAVWIGMGAMAVKVWVGLLKFLARAD
jgi:hypothetical protein